MFYRVERDLQNFRNFANLGANLGCYKTRMINKDTLWKGIIEDLAEEFVHFFFADYINQIDLAKGFIFLDKELEQLSPKTASKLRRADKLFKAWLKTGEEQWFLVHVEVQGYSDPDFARRMFEYAYRIQDRYQRPATALVIYTNTDRRYHFQRYQYAFFGTELSYHFNTFILMDHSHTELRKSSNLFSLVLEVARRDLDLKRKSDELRLQTKLELVRYLFQRGIPKSKIRHLLDFIAHYTRFEESYFLPKFEESIQTFTKSNRPMGIREAIINDVKEQGINEAKHGMVARAWKKGLSIQDIVELADLPEEEVKVIIRELEKEDN